MSLELLATLELMAHKDNNLIDVLEENLERLKKGRHNGITDKLNIHYLNEEDTEKYIQYKTFKFDNEEGKFIYEDIINLADYPLLSLELWNDKNKEILSFIFYFEKDKIVNQIRKLSIDQYLKERENNEAILKSKNDKNTTIIKMSFLEFIESIDEEIKEIDLNYLSNTDENISDSAWQKVKTIGLKILLFASILSISFGIAVTTGLITLVPISLTLTAIAGWMTLEIVKTVWNNLKNEAMNYIGTKEVVKSVGKSIKKFLGHTWTGLATIFTFGLYKGTYQEKKTQKPKSDKEKIKDLENKITDLNKKQEKRKSQNNKLWQQFFSKFSETEKRNIILEKFHEFIEQNTDTSFDDLWKWLSYKIDEGNGIWEQKMAKKLENENVKWNEYKKFLKELDPIIAEELKARYEHKKTNDEKLKLDGQKMWKNFTKNEINNEWNYSWMIDFENEQDKKNRTRVNDSPFKSIKLNKNECLNNSKPSTSTGIYHLL